MESNSSVNRSDDVFNEKGLCLSIFTTTDYFLYFFFGSLSVVIMCGNLLVITSIIYFKQLHTPTNLLILSLAVADLIVGVLILPLGVIKVNRGLCWLIFIIDLSLCASSVLNMCFISLDRYFAVCQPLRYRTKINVHVIVIMILVSWSLPAIGYRLSFLHDILCFYLPALITSAIYLKILTVAQRQARSIHNTTCQRAKSESKMERKATKTLLIVMGVFLICWTPFFLCWGLYGMKTLNIPPETLFILRYIGWFNSMLNPFIYGFFYSWFRSAFRMIISGKIFQGDFTHSKLS